MFIVFYYNKLHTILLKIIVLSTFDDSSFPTSYQCSLYLILGCSVTFSIFSSCSTTLVCSWSMRWFMRFWFKDVNEARRNKRLFFDLLIIISSAVRGSFIEYSYFQSNLIWLMSFIRSKIKNSNSLTWWIRLIYNFLSIELKLLIYIVMFFVTFFFEVLRHFDVILISNLIIMFISTRKLILSFFFLNDWILYLCKLFLGLLFFFEKLVYTHFNFHRRFHY